MTEPKFTQEKWIRDNSMRTAINAGAKHIAMVNFFNLGPNNPSTINIEEHNANARLIESSPDLYRSLQKILWDYKDKCMYKRELVKDAEWLLEYINVGDPVYAFCYMAGKDDPSLNCKGDPK